MNKSIQMLRRPLAVVAVTAVLFSAAACSGSSTPASPPAPATSAPVSEPATSPSAPASPSASEPASPTASPSRAAPSARAAGSDALLAAGELGLKEVSDGTVVSIESERDGWEVHVVSAAGDEQRVRTDGAGTAIVSGPTDDRPDAEDRTENKLFAQAEVDYLQAVRAVEGLVEGGEIRELNLDRENRRTVWEADVVVGSQQRSVQIDADNARVISNRIDD